MSAIDLDAVSLVVVPASGGSSGLDGKNYVCVSVWVLVSY